MNEQELRKTAEDFKESSAYILEGYLDMCQADLPRKKRCWLEMDFDQEAYTDGKKVHIGLFTLADVFDFFTNRYPDVDPVAYFALMNEYLLGHENQHTRSTREKDWRAASIAVKQAILREISKIRGDGKVFRAPKEYDAYIDQLRATGLDISKDTLDKVAHFIENSIEDGRIERIRSVKRPGFGTIMRLVRATLYEMQDAQMYLLDPDNPGTRLNPASMPDDKALSVLYGQILSLATCSVYEKNFFSLFAGTKIGNDAHRMIPYIRNGVNSGCCRGIVEASEGVAVILAPYVYASMQKQNLSQQTQAADQKMQQSGSGSSKEQHTTQANEEETDEGQSKSVVQNNSGEESLNQEGKSAGQQKQKGQEKGSEESKGNTKTSMSGQAGNQEGEQSEEQGGAQPSGGAEEATGSGSEKGQNASQSGVFNDAQDEITNSTEARTGNKLDPFQEREAKASSGTDKELDEVLEKAMTEAASHMAGISGQVTARKAETKKKIAACKQTKLPEFKPKTTAQVFPGIRFKEVFRKYKLDTPMPYDLQVRADKFANDVEELFRNQEIPQVRCVNTGKIDAANIYKLGMNMIDCFEQEQEVPEFDGCAYFLCDNSGSMGYGNGSKRYLANTALAVIEQAFSKHMPLKMTAFDSCGQGIIHEVLKNWDEELPVSGAYNFAIKGRGGAGNADGYSIRVATEELLERSEEEKILIVLSDGAPAQVTYGGKLTAEDEVKMAVEDARAAGIRVISIYFEQSNYRTPEVFEYMYGKHESIVCDPDDVEDELAELMQTFVFG